MNDFDDVTPQVRAWLRQPVALSEDGIATISGAISRTPQQRGLLPPLSPAWRGGDRSTAGVLGVGSVAAILSALVLLGFLVAPVVVEAPAATTPDWPGVEFTPVEHACADGCDRGAGGVWRVSAEHLGDLGSTQAIAFGPSGAPWLLSDDRVWQLGAAADSLFSPRSAAHDLAVDPDGVVWVASELGLHSYDGRDWTAHRSAAPLRDLDVAPDGTVYAVGGGRGQDVTVVRVAEEGIASSTVGVIDPERYPTAIVVDVDGRVWVGAFVSWFEILAKGESLLATGDGTEWQTARPLGPTKDVAAFTLVRGPDGSVWSSLAAMDDDGALEGYLARCDGRAWSVTPVDAERRADAARLAAIGPQGTAWFIGSGERQDGLAGVLAYDGSTWTRYLGDLEFGTLVLAPDGLAVASTIPGFDEEGLLIAIRHAPRSPLP